MNKDEVKGGAEKLGGKQRRPRERPHAVAPATSPSTRNPTPDDFGPSTAQLKKIRR